MSEQFILKKYLPYRLNAAAKNVSVEFSGNYCDRFNISVNEWRVLAVVAQQAELSAEDVSGLTAMEKVAVSRAVAKLLDKDMITRRFSTKDRRRSQLSLSTKGQDIYQQIAPLAQQFEKSLLEGFTQEEIDVVNKMLTRMIAFKA